MNCEKINEIYKKTCEKEFVCYKENFNINYPVVEELHMRNCLLAMTMLYRHCSAHDKTKTKSEAANKQAKRFFP